MTRTYTNKTHSSVCGIAQWKINYLVKQTKAQIDMIQMLW